MRQRLAESEARIDDDPVARNARRLARPRAPKVPGMTSSPSSSGVGMNEARPPKW